MPDPLDFRLPELTRDLRGLGAPGAPGSDHDALFGPWLAARRAAAHAAAWPERLAAFDPPTLAASLSEAIAVLARARFPRRAPDRRALTAELEERAAPLARAIAALAPAAAVVRAASDTDRPAAWTAWVAALREAFVAADAVWQAWLPVLADSRGARGAFWRRALRLALAASAALPTATAAQRAYVRVSGVPAESLLVRGFDVVGARDGTILVVADPEDQARLAAMGGATPPFLPAGADPRRFTAQPVPSTPRVYRPFDDPARGVRAFLDSLARANPRVHVDTIGRSTEGRPLLAVKVGARDDAATRPNVLFLATYHAREWIATEVALRLLRHLARPAGTDARVDSLVARRDIWIVPVVNPDGYEYTFIADRLWRKTRSPQAGGAVGVDLNRNHEALWGLDNVGSSPNPRSDVFRGPTPASEPETRAVQAFHDAHPPVLSLSYHSFAGLLLYPPGHTFGLLPGDLGVYRALAGTPLRSAVTDRLAGSSRTRYFPGVGWLLYPTNGEYTDWAASRHGTLAFTPELTSGDENGAFYGFEFPDDEARIQRVFEDNLPFALDVLESAADPLAYLSLTTGLRAERVALESVSPDVRVRVPGAAADATRVTVAGDRTLATSVDPAGGRFQRRVVSEAVARPSSVTVRAGNDGGGVRFDLLLAQGAEPDERTGWIADGFVAGSDAVAPPAGNAVWRAEFGTLRSPVVRVPATVDTVSVLFRARYDGSAFTERPFAEVRVSRDSARSWQPVTRLAGSAPRYVPDGVTVGGVRGAAFAVEFRTEGLPLRLDEITVVAHAGGVAPPAAGGAMAPFVPSENPVRGDAVWMTWPHDGAGELLLYDFGGRLAWRTAVAAGTPRVAIPIAAERLSNGAYLVIARAGGRVARARLFVLRPG